MEESDLQLDVESTSDVMRKVTGEIAWPPVSEKLNEAYQELGKNVQLKGFRKGKVPKALLKKMFHKRIAAEIAHGLVQEALVDAIGRLDLRPVMPLQAWDIDEGDIEDGQALSFTAKLEVLPEVECENWKALEVKTREPKVDDADVDRYLEQKQQELTQFLPVEGRPVQAGDIIVGDLMGKLGSEPVDIERFTFALIEEGGDPRTTDPERRALLPHICAAMLGKEVNEGDEIDLDFTLPGEGEIPENWLGQSMQGLLSVTRVRERHVPEIDDEMAKDIGEADSLSDYKDLVRKQLLEQDEQSSKEELKRAVEKALVDANPIEVTPTLIEKQLNSVMHRALQAFQMRGMDPSALGMDEEALRESFRPSAEEEVKKALLTDAIAKAEKIEVSEEELDARLQEIADAREENLARVKAEYEKEGGHDALRVVMREEKVIDLLLSEARVTTIDESETAEDEAGEGDDKAKDEAPKEAPEADADADDKDE